MIFQQTMGLMKCLEDFLSALTSWISPWHVGHGLGLAFWLPDSAARSPQKPSGDFSEKLHHFLRIGIFMNFHDPQKKWGVFTCFYTSKSLSSKPQTSRTGIWGADSNDSILDEASRLVLGWKLRTEQGFFRTGNRFTEKTGGFLLRIPPKCRCEVTQASRFEATHFRILCN
jgi:hypothetical protein